jgi:hypothetical protein
MTTTPPTTILTSAGALALLSGQPIQFIVRDEAAPASINLLEQMQQHDVRVQYSTGDSRTSPMDLGPAKTPSRPESNTTNLGFEGVNQWREVNWTGTISPLLQWLVQDPIAKAASTLIGEDLITEIPDDPIAGYDVYARSNWDGHEAEPITLATVGYARKLLVLTPDIFGAPDIAPGADGSIGFYWSADQGPFRSLCIDIGPGKKWRAYWRLRDGTFNKVMSRQIDHTTAATLRFLFESFRA